MKQRLFTPFLGVALYAWLLVAAALDGTVHRAVRQSGLLDIIGVIVAGWVALEWWRGPSPRLPRPSHALGWALVALCGWVAVCAGAAAIRGEFTPDTAYRTRQFALAGVIFFATTNGYAHRWHLATLAFPLAAIVLAEAATEFDALALDQNIAAAAVLTIPALVGAGQSMVGTLSWTATAAAVGLSAVIAITRNRGGGMALLAIIVVFAWQSARRWVLLALVAVLLAAGTWMLSGSGYFNRYSDVWTGGPAFDSVQDRFDLWADAWRLAIAHPVVGVGPGNYGAVVGGSRDPHNHVMAMLAEAGFPGALLYTAFFGSALLVAAVRMRQTSARPIAGTSVAGTVGFLVVGFFLGLQTHALAFVYAGLAQVAACDSSRTDRR
jgi:O-antigen ligase